MFYPNCSKKAAFKLFDEGKRPAEIFSLLPLKKTTIFRYHQAWKREKEAQLRAAEDKRFRQSLMNWTHAIEMDLDNIRRFPRNRDPETTARLQRMKSRARALLRNPSLATIKEKETLLKNYSS